MGLPLGPRGGGRDVHETAVYIAQMARELRALAARSNLGFLAYLLGMVENDATETARERDPSRGDESGKDGG
jgi:hypothetical protein